MRTKLLSFIAGVTISIPSIEAAYSDTIIDFTVTGSFAFSCSPLCQPISTPLSGDLQIDVTTGTVLFNTGTRIVDALGTFVGDGGNGPTSTGWSIELLNSARSTLSFSFTTLPTPRSLVGFTGGEIVSGISCPNAPNFPCLQGLAGTITAPTPLPTALPLFASGLGAIGLVAWRKRRKISNLAAA